jgi:hypothetical protein
MKNTTQLPPPDSIHMTCPVIWWYYNKGANRVV